MIPRSRVSRSLLSPALSALAGIAVLCLAARAAEPPPPSPPHPAHRIEIPSQERIDAGKRSFHVYCGSCHGESARGDGPVARDLKVPPADLTALAKANGGTFPDDRVYRAIDGRTLVRGHGSSEMPVWGLTFEDRGRDADQADAVRERIRDLLAYLRSIQAT